MRLQTVPASRGIVWVRQGFRAFFRQPFAFAGLFAIFLFGVFVCVRLPEIGVFIALAFVPVFVVGFMLATRIAVAGGTPTARVFVDPLRGPRRKAIAMVQLGICFALAAFLVVWVSDVLDGGAFEDMIDALQAGQLTPDALAERMAADRRIELGLLIRAALAGLLSVPFWHAPALMHWEGHGLAKSLFSSTIACWRNKTAFAMYSLAWFGVLFLTNVASTLLVLVAGNIQIAAFMAMPIFLMLATIFYVSLYFTFADCFVDDADAESSTLT
jgi:hypothetical protein